MMLKKGRINYKELIRYFPNTIKSKGVPKSEWWNMGRVACSVKDCLNVKY